MAIVIPQFRAAGADYYFLCDASGGIVHVVYPRGDQFLRAGEHD